MKCWSSTCDERDMEKERKLGQKWNKVRVALHPAK